MQPPLLTDGTVFLSVPTEADVDRVTECCQDPDIQAMTTIPAPYGRADGVSFVTEFVPAGWADGSKLTWALRRGAQDPVVGMISLSVQEAGSAEVGYWLAADARGIGLMSRALELVVGHAFSASELSLTRLFWCAVAGNWPSRRVAWRQGFRVEGTVRGHLVQRGARLDAWVGTLLVGDQREPAEPWPAGYPTR